MTAKPILTADTFWLIRNASGTGTRFPRYCLKLVCGGLALQYPVPIVEALGLQSEDLVFSKC